MNELLTLGCPSCGGRTKISTVADQFVCDYCGNSHVFQLPTNPQSSLLRTREVGYKNRRLVARPSGVYIQRKDNRIELSWRWFSVKYIFLLFFVIAWDGFLVFWYSMAFSFGGAPWIMFVFPIAHVAVGVILTYTTLAGLFNRTTIKIGNEDFIVHHDPFPWPGELNVPVSELDQLYCTKKINHGKNVTTVTYMLKALLKDGSEKNLVSNLESPDVSYFLEQEVEKILLITDRPVAGEIP